MVDQKTFLELKQIGLSNACSHARNELKDVNTYEEFIKLNNAIQYAYHMLRYYKNHIDESIVSELEDVIIEHPDYVYLYAKNVIQGPWQKGEDVIASDPYNSYRYAKHIIKNKWEKGESIISMDYECQSFYNRFLESLSK